jgi:hypothetical protein
MKAATIGGILACAILLYPLSSGPVWRIYARSAQRAQAVSGPEAELASYKAGERLRTFFTVYSPIIGMSQRSKGFSQVFNWYLGLWEPLWDEKAKS